MEMQYHWMTRIDGHFDSFKKVRVNHASEVAGFVSLQLRVSDLRIYDLNRSLSADLKAKYWSFVTTNGYKPNDSGGGTQSRTAHLERGNMVPRDGLEPPVHGFSVAVLASRKR